MRRLAAPYRDFSEGVKARSPAGPDAHVALLTPGPYNETYFEQSYLARYLGVTLVEGTDLTVRGERLFLKTLHGLRPVDALTRWKCAPIRAWACPAWCRRCAPARC